jgi:hypothetical protein
MPKGPHESRLDTYVANGSVASIRHAAHLWDQGSTVLQRLSHALESTKPDLLTRFGPQTGKQAALAFDKVAKSVRDQAAEMAKASGALTSAGDALEDAQATHQKLGNAPASPPSDPTLKSGESPEHFHQRQRDANGAQSTYATESAAREQQSQQAVSDVDTHYGQAITVMESIHGQPPTVGGESGGTGAGTVPAGSIPNGSLPPGYQPPSYPHPGLHPTPWEPPTGHQHDPPPTVDPPPHHPVNQPTDPGTGDPGSGGHDGPGGPGTTTGHPGIPQGPGFPGNLPPGTTTPTGGIPTTDLPPGSLSTGPSSTLVGGLMSGTMIGGASGLSGALRRSSVTGAALTEEQILASRTAGTAGAAAGGRGGAAGATGAGRGTGGTGAGGRGGKGRKKPKKGDVDFFEDNDDWLDDEEAAPGVLH